MNIITLSLMIFHHHASSQRTEESPTTQWTQVSNSLLFISFVTEACYNYRSVFGRLLDLLPSWKPTSEDKLEQAESNVLKRKYKCLVSTVHGKIWR